MCPTDWSEEEKRIAELLTEALMHWPVPERQEAAFLDILHGSELEGVLGRPWQEVFADRRHFVHHGDWYLLKERGLAYYLPAYVLTALDEDCHGWLDILLPFLAERGEAMLKEYESESRRAVCKALRLLAKLPYVSPGSVDDEEFEPDDELLKFHAFVSGCCAG